MNETKLGPTRRAPKYYAGETYGKHLVQYLDVERYPNGVVPGIRDKLARRLIRKALKRRYSKTEKALTLPRAMQAQAAEVARDEGKSTRWARRLFAKELEIHRPVYVPTQKELRAMRTQKRKDKRAGKKDAIAQVIEALAQARK